MLIKDIIMDLVGAARLGIIQRRIEKFQKKLNENKRPTRNAYYKAQLARLHAKIKP